MGINDESDTMSDGVVINLLERKHRSAVSGPEHSTRGGLTYEQQKENLARIRRNANERTKQYYRLWKRTDK